MKFCGCLTIRRDSRDDPTNKRVKRHFLKRDLPASNDGSTKNAKIQKDRTKSNAQSNTRQNILKKQSSSGSINKVVLRDNHHNVSKRRSVTFANDSETEQRKFLRLNKAKRGSIHELQLSENKRARSSPNVNHSIARTINTSYETTTCDELDNSQEKKAVVRRRKRSKSPRKQLPSEILDAIKFDLVESVGLDDNQLKTIPYENVKTSSQPIRISLSSFSSQQHQGRRRRSSPFNRSSNIVYSASTNMLYYQAQPTVISIAQVKSTKDISISQRLENFTANIGHVRTLDVQENERVRLECILTSTKDAEEVMWMRIRSPHNPDILSYRDSVVYAPDRIELEQRRYSLSRTPNGTLIETYILTLIILRPTIDDQGRYICAKGRTVFAEYDLFIIVPTQFVDDTNFTQQRSVLEGSTLRLSCSAYGRPLPSITWFYRIHNGKLISLSNGTVCQATKCELHLVNYTRYDPKIIECIADNEKSTRISKVVHIDVYYPPKVTTHVRTLIRSTSIDVFLECSADANPTPLITWLDDNRQEINDYNFYTMKTNNLSSILSFSVFSNEYPNVLYYCQSNNSIGTVEKLIDISSIKRISNSLCLTFYYLGFIDFNLKSDHEATTVRILTTHSLRRQKIGK
ncbi:unnamed protein product [Rotaria magnacalcarata]|uniref:Ig-like domain-containing protein n=2 Tax=Rotaria magnacalcarata TaxID=392030 RepID=A0A815W6I1_9BILA|nr:unnamed protein product [Rotaria magnacalcarata]